MCGEMTCKETYISQDHLAQRQKKTNLEQGKQINKQPHKQINKFVNNPNR